MNVFFVVGYTWNCNWKKVRLCYFQRTVDESCSGKSIVT